MLPPEYLPPATVTRAFNRVARHYQTHSPLETHLAENLRERLTELKLTPNRILDAGTGTGRIPRLLRQQYPKATIIGIDNAHQMTRQARRQIPWLTRYLQPREHYITANAHQLPLPTESINLITANLLLLWYNDIQPLLQELARVLHPQGTLLLTTLGTDSLKEIRTSWATIDTHSHVNHFIDMRDIGDALHQAGFNNPVTDVDWLKIHRPDPHTLFKQIQACGATNHTQGRTRGLTSKHRWQNLLNAYETQREPEGIPLSLEIVYAYAAGKRPKTTTTNTTTIPIHQIRKHNSPP